MKKLLGALRNGGEKAYLDLLHALLGRKRVDRLVFGGDDWPDIGTPQALAAGEWPFMRHFNLTRLASQDGAPLGLWVRPPDDDSKPVYVVFHGREGNWQYAGAKNKSLIPSHNHRMEWLQALDESGAGVIAVHTRGHGASRDKSRGNGLNEEVLEDDMRVIADYLERESIDPSRVIVAGHSMGSALAVMLAQELTHRGRPPAVLGLITPFARFDDMVCRYMKQHWALRLLKEENIAARVDVGLDSAKRVERLAPEKTTLYIAANRQDEIIPYEQCTALRDAAEKKAFTVHRRDLSHQRVRNDAYPHCDWDGAQIAQDLNRLFSQRGSAPVAENGSEPGLRKHTDIVKGFIGSDGASASIATGM